MYGGTVTTKTPPIEAPYYLYFCLYTLAEKLLDRELQDRIIDAAILATRKQSRRHDKMKVRYPEDASIKVVYENYPKGSPARRLLVDLHVRFCSEAWVFEDTPADFVRDLAEEMYVNCELKDESKYQELEMGVPRSQYHSKNDSES